MQLGNRTCFCYFALWAVSGMLCAQPYEIEPVTAEWVPMEREYADARTAPLGKIDRIAAGADGDIYFSCIDLRRVFRLRKDGRLEVFAGTGKMPTHRLGASGRAEKADLELPAGLVWDGAGTLYVSDPGRIYAIKADRSISTVAGNGRINPLADEAAAVEVTAHGAGQIAMSASGGLLFYDYRANAIREVGRDGVMRTFAGEEPKTSPRAMHPRVDLAVPYTRTVSVDGKGSVWFATGPLVHRVDYRNGGHEEGVVLQQQPKCTIEGMAHHRSGALALACESPGGLWIYPRVDGPPRILRRHVYAVAFAEDGSLLFSEGNRLYRVREGGEPVHLAGGGLFGNGGPATEAWLGRAGGIAMDGEGRIVIADRTHHQVRRIGRDGRIEVVAGIGEGGYTGDGGPAREARLYEPVGVGVGKDGSIYVLVINPGAVRRIYPDGTIRTITRPGLREFDDELPSALALDGEDRVLIGTQTKGRILRLGADGRLELLAGTRNLATSGVTGDARTTPLGRVHSLLMRPDGMLLFTQAVGSNLVRRITPDRRVENVAGSVGRAEVLGTAPARAGEVRLEEPMGLAELPGEGLLVATAFRLLLLKEDGMLQVYADTGDWNQGFAGLVADGNKNVYVSDYATGALRVARRAGGLPASAHRMAPRHRPAPVPERGREREFGWAWPIGVGLVLAAAPWGARRWWYRRQKARLLRGVDSDLSAVFSPRGVSPRTDVSGTLDGRYRILESLAQGGSAVVYKAEDKRNPGRVVAVKVFDLPEEDPVAVQRRLLRECVASSRVRHAAVAPMLDVGMTEGGQPYLVMEYVEGESLRAVLRRGLMEREKAVRLLGELAEAVSAAHGQGVLHLDIKPENLMIRAESGRLVLIDFGLAAVAEGGALATHMSSVGGTLDYMAPEQLLGHVSAGADIYACGAVALEMLSGKKVAELELPANNQDLELTAERVRGVAGDLPEAAVGVLARMLSLRPEERPAAVAELVTALG